MRLGEIAALRWRYVDLDRGLIAVVETAEQTRTGVRIKPPKSGTHRQRLAMQIARLRRCIGAGYSRPSRRTGNRAIFCGPIGCGALQPGQRPLSP
jgi:integrase